MANLRILDSMEFEPEPEIRRLALRIIKAYPEALGHIEIDRVAFYLEITGTPARCGRRVAGGACFKVRPPFRETLALAGSKVEWIVAFFSAETEGKSDEWLAVLMLHELMHIGPDGKLVEHDIEDFSTVLHTAGIDWAEDRNVPDIIRKKIRLAA